MITKQTPNADKDHERKIIALEEIEKGDLEWSFFCHISLHINKHQIYDPNPKLYWQIINI